MQNQPSSSTSGPWPMILAGVLGGVLSWGMIEPLHDHFQLPEKLTNEMKTAGMTLPPDLQKRFDEAKQVQHFQNTSLTIGLFGLAVGGLFGLFAGIANRSTSASFIGLLAGGTLGALFGAAGGLAEVAVERLLLQQPNLDKMYRAMAIHSVAWVVTAVGIALSVGIAAGRRQRGGRSFVAAAAAGVVAALIYPMLAAIMFSSDRPELAVPTGTWNRLFWTTLPATLMGISIGRTGARSKVSVDDKEPPDASASLQAK